MHCTIYTIKKHEETTIIKKVFTSSRLTDSMCRGTEYFVGLPLAEPLREPLGKL